MVVGFTKAIVTDGGAAGETRRRRAARRANRERQAQVARIVVDVMLRREIHDPQGEAIASASRRLGFPQVLGVRQGKRFEVELSGPADEAALAKVTELAGDLLANPVIEEFTLREG